MIQDFVLQFVPYGYTVQGDLVGGHTLYLDVGNDLGPGVVDHHHIAAYQASTASLVLRNPECIQKALASPAADKPFAIILHIHPDLDCVVAAYLAQHYLRQGAFPAAAAVLARYADLVDAGRAGFAPDNPFGLYTAYMMLAHRLGMRAWRQPDDQWRALVSDGLELLAYVSEELESQGGALTALDAFACPGLFSQRDRQDLLEDQARYLAKLHDPACQARMLRMHLPGLLGGRLEADALLVRDVQDPDDPQRVMFFKDWARSDAANSPGGQGFTALSVYQPPAGPRGARCIISVKPDSGISLEGLGRSLDLAEPERPGEPPAPKRPGYDRPDPWYDGRGHGYTIVDSPRAGTGLGPEKIESIFLEFGRSSSTAAEEPSLPSLDELASSSAEAVAEVGHISFLADASRQGWRKAERPALEVFISYPRSAEAWVDREIHAKLAAWRGAERVFIDRHHIVPGFSWLASLADAIAHCRIFLAVFCPEYFRSPFCLWELQLAVIRDPVVAQGHIVPVVKQAVELPNYCKHVQVLACPDDDTLWPLLKANLEERLNLPS